MSSSYKIIENIKCYAPELAFENNNYPNGYFEMLDKIEPKNFWYRSRSRIIEYLFTKYLNVTHPAKVLEIGCGTGFVLKGLSKFKLLKLTGAELNIDALRYAMKNLPQVAFVQFDARKIPFEEEFDAIGAFDVLEHIDEDELVIESIHKSLKRGGYLFLSVPQHECLWSALDNDFYHKRRYSRRELLKKLIKANFSVLFVSSFVFTLLPLMYLSRLRGKKMPTSKKKVEYCFDELIVNPILNTIGELFIRIDEILIKLGIRLPVGGSLVLVARKC